MFTRGTVCSTAPDRRLFQAARNQLTQLMGSGLTGMRLMTWVISALSICGLAWGAFLLVPAFLQVTGN